MNYMEHASTAELDEGVSTAIGRWPAETPAGSLSERSRALLFVDQFGQSKVIFAPTVHDVSSGHTSGLLEGVCDRSLTLPKFAGKTVEESFLERAKENYLHLLVTECDSHANTVEWYPLLRKEAPDEFLSIQAFGTFEVQNAEVEPLQLHPELDD